MTLLLLLFVHCVIKCLVKIRFIRLRYVVLYCYCIEYCYTYLNTASYILLYYHIYHLYTTVMESCCMTISLMWYCILVAFSYLTKKSGPSHFCCRVVICWMLQRCEVVLPKCWCLNYGAVVHKISVAISNLFSLIT